LLSFISGELSFKREKPDCHFGAELSWSLFPL
jgi:hypothetical protein